MFHTPTKDEIEKQEKDLIKFIKEDLENWCLMYNHMLLIQEVRKKAKEKTLLEIK